MALSSGVCGQAACDGLLTAYPVMLKAFHAKVASSFFLALITLVFSRPFNLELVLPETDSEPLMTDEGTVRSERSANISHIIGISRKIQIIVNKGMLLQMSPDGTVSGTGDDNDYSKSTSQEFMPCKTCNQNVIALFHSSSLGTR